MCEGDIILHVIVLIFYSEASEYRTSLCISLKSYIDVIFDVMSLFCGGR